MLRFLKYRRWHHPTCQGDREKQNLVIPSLQIFSLTMRKVIEDGFWWAENNCVEIMNKMATTIASTHSAWEAWLLPGLLQEFYRGIWKGKIGTSVKSCVEPFCKCENASKCFFSDLVTCRADESKCLASPTHITDYNWKGASWEWIGNQDKQLMFSVTEQGERSAGTGVW